MVWYVSVFHFLFFPFFISGDYTVRDTKPTHNMSCLQTALVIICNRGQDLNKNKVFVIMFRITILS